MKKGDYTIRDLQSASDFEACFQLQVETWGADYAELVPKSILRLSQKLGGVAAGAFDQNDRMVGLVFGIPGVENKQLVHWSDMLAVKPEVQNQGVGEAMKRYQRSVLLERGVRRMYWSFDPLEARNAYFNFVRLGIIAREYTRDFYGESDSPLHRGLGTDRLIALWELGSARVRSRLDREPIEPHQGGVRIVVPSNIQQLKKDDPAAAREWRTQTRAAFEGYLGSGYVVVGFERSPSGGTYVLQREPALLS